MFNAYKYIVTKRQPSLRPSSLFEQEKPLEYCVQDIYVVIGGIARKDNTIQFCGSKIVFSGVVANPLAIVG